ncbi:hypothetical protein [Enterocloster bolteae]|uniref:hypothetical protein n=1 Tax=Enterocloster bolteae TaxID=208479 RepID=UPI002A83C324|nr:hypothetical protein [Enterocloster bolteae]
MNYADERKMTLVFLDTDFRNKEFWEYTHGERPEAGGVPCLTVIDNEPEVGEALVIDGGEFGVCGKRVFYPLESKEEVWVLVKRIKRANRRVKG